MALKPLEAAVEPILIVCEKIQVRKCEDTKNSFYLKFGNDEMFFTADNEEDEENWMLKVCKIFLKKYL